MDFESEFLWHAFALLRLVSEKHLNPDSKPGDRCIYIGDDVAFNVVETFSTFEARSRGDVIAEAIRRFVEARAVEGNPRAAWCLQMYYKTQRLEDGEFSSVDKTEPN